MQSRRQDPGAKCSFRQRPLRRATDVSSLPSGWPSICMVLGSLKPPLGQWDVQGQSSVVGNTKLQRSAKCQGVPASYHVFSWSKAKEGRQSSVKWMWIEWVTLVFCSKCSTLEKWPPKKQTKWNKQLLRQKFHTRAICSTYPALAQYWFHGWRKPPAPSSLLLSMSKVPKQSRWGPCFLDPSGHNHAQLQQRRSHSGGTKRSLGFPRIKGLVWSSRPIFGLVINQRHSSKVNKNGLHGLLLVLPTVISWDFFTYFTYVGRHTQLEFDKVTAICNSETQQASQKALRQELEALQRQSEDAFLPTDEAFLSPSWVKYL